MMLKKKSNPWARLKYLYVLPLAVIAVAAFARPEISSESVSYTHLNSRAGLQLDNRTWELALARKINQVKCWMANLEVDSVLYQPAVNKRCV